MPLTTCVPSCSKVNYIRIPVCICKKYIRKFDLIQIYSQKRKNNLNGLSDHFGYSSLILYQHLTNGNFLKVNCSVETESILMSILCHVKLKSIGLSCALSGFYYPCMIL